MLRACETAFPKADITILSAAVADYRPNNAADVKIKKGDQELTITLVPTQDILATLGKKKQSHQKLVGFALETNNELEYAMGKLARKNLDWVVLNSLRNTGAGFGHPTNQVTLINKDKAIFEVPLQSKPEVARIIWEHLI
jgi:phosphopantothenoylcysteine decarboxylase/phosphopantothenate--cysteine ligase